MRKQQLMELKVGDKVISKKDNSISTVTGIADKVELDNNKQYSQSTMIRWYSLYEEDNTDTEEFDVESFNSEQQQEQDTTADTEQTTKKDVVEGDSTNTITLQAIQNLVDLHNCYLIQRKEYLGVYKEGYKGCIAMIRNCRGGGGIHIDFKQKIWTALDEEYRQVVSKNYYTGIYDKSRRLQRIGYCRDLDVLEVIICTALQIA